jgi:type IV pilus assembly protein PilM
MAKRSRRMKPVVGLELEPGCLAAARVSVDGGITVEQAALAPIEPHVLRDGEVTDVEAVTTALKDLWAQNKGLGKSVRVGVANARIVVRTLNLPPVEGDAELTALVRFHAEQELPMPLDQAVLDFGTIGSVETPEGPRTQVVVVAARRDMIAGVLAAVRAAGLKVEGIDLSAFGMVRALRTSDEPTLYLAVGGLTNLAVADGRGCTFTRVTGGGLEAMVVALAERLQCPLGEARDHLFQVGLETPISDFGDDADVAVVARTVLTSGVRQIAGEARSSLDFHQAQSGHTAEPVERVVFTGPAAEVAGFAAALENELGLIVEVRGVTEARPGALGTVPAVQSSVAAGLAVEEVPA